MGNSNPPHYRLHRRWPEPTATAPVGACMSRRDFPMRISLAAAAAVAALILSGCSQEPAERSTEGQAPVNDKAETARAPAPAGPPGPQGPQGPAGPTGPAGPAGANLRFAESTCEATRCPVACNQGERIVNAFAPGASGTFIYDTESSATYRQSRRREPTKIVLVCVRG